MRQFRGVSLIRLSKERLTRSKIMGWLQRLFGVKKPENPQQAINATPAPQAAPQNAPAGQAPAATETIAPERVGLHGEYDQSGLAKRVALAYDEDAQLDDID